MRIGWVIHTHMPRQIREMKLVTLHSLSCLSVDCYSSSSSLSDVDQKCLRCEFQEGMHSVLPVFGVAHAIMQSWNHRTHLCPRGAYLHRASSVMPVYEKCYLWPDWVSGMHLYEYASIPTALLWRISWRTDRHLLRFVVVLISAEDFSCLCRVYPPLSCVSPNCLSLGCLDLPDQICEEELQFHRWWYSNSMLIMALW